jgi:hypothetical protein
MVVERELLSFRWTGVWDAPLRNKLSYFLRNPALRISEQPQPLDGTICFSNRHEFLEAMTNFLNEEMDIRVAKIDRMMTVSKGSKRQAEREVRRGNRF